MTKEERNGGNSVTCWAVALGLRCEGNLKDFGEVREKKKRKKRKERKEGEEEKRRRKTKQRNLVPKTKIKKNQKKSSLISFLLSLLCRFGDVESFLLVPSKMDPKIHRGFGFASVSSSFDVKVYFTNLLLNIWVAVTVFLQLAFLSFSFLFFSFLFQACQLALKDEKYKDRNLSVQVAKADPKVFSPLLLFFSVSFVASFFLFFAPFFFNLLMTVSSISSKSTIRTPNRQRRRRKEKEKEKRKRRKRKRKRKKKSKKEKKRRKRTARQPQKEKDRLF